MNNQKESTTGAFTAQDKQGTPVIIEWQKTTLLAPEFAVAMKEFWPLTCAAFTPVEMQFLRAHPEVVGTEDYFKPFEPLFKNGVQAVDWDKVEATMQALLKSYQIFDASTLGAEVIATYAEDVFYIVTVKDQQTKTLRGYITFMFKANRFNGIMSIAVDNAYRGRGLGKLLMSSIFKIAPDIECVHDSTRITNDTMRKAYLSWGFTKDENPTMHHAFNPKHWIFFEYNAKKSDILQKTAAGFKAI